MQVLSSLEPIAVTGATGFIGSHLVSALVSAGCRPVLLARSPKPNAYFANFGEMARWTRLDLTDDDSINRVLQRERPKTIIHLAGTRGHGEAGVCAEVNFHATARLLTEACRAGVERIVIVGSAEEYGNQAGPLAEGLPLKAETPYGISKAMATNYALITYARQHCPVVVARPFSVYGPGQPPTMFVQEAIEAAVRNAPFSMSSGQQKRDLVFVEDVVNGLIAAACTSGIEGSVINIGTGQPHRLRDVAARIWKIAGTVSPLHIGARITPPVELYDTWADTTLARRLLNWQATVDLESGLSRTIAFEWERLASKTKSCQAM